MKNERKKPEEINMKMSMERGVNAAKGEGGRDLNQARLRLSLGLHGSGDVAGGQALRALGYCKLNSLAFVQRLVPIGLNSRVVYKHIISACAGDKTIALRCIKPFNGSFFSQCFLLLFI
jgi:hypothetical protein